jgi:3-hydroxyacyl-CoA dehydrogenase
MSPIKSVAIIGCGAIGASWAALFIAQGLQVKAFDINPAAETYLRNFIRDALPVLSSIGLVKNTEAKPEDVIFSTSLQQALQDVDFVQENGPERIDFKRKLFQQIGEQLGPNVIIATSSSGLTCSSIQEGMSAAARPERCLVGHPFNPPHLIPLVEVVGGSQTSPTTIQATMTFYTTLGKKPIHLQKEVPGHVANRIQAAVMREVFHILQQDVCSVQDIDDAVSYGPGLRWGVMGPNMLFHLGGGEGGIEHFANHLLGPLQGWYAKENPVVDEDLRRKWIEGTKWAVGERGYGGLVKQRDEELVRLLNVRREWDAFADGKGKEES